MQRWSTGLLLIGAGLVNSQGVVNSSPDDICRGAELTGRNATGDIVDGGCPVPTEDWNEMLKVGDAVSTVTV